MAPASTKQQGTRIIHTDNIICLNRNTGRKNKIGKRIGSKFRHYISVPSYFEAYIQDSSSYAEKKAYSPQPTGCERIKLYYQQYDKILKWSGERYSPSSYNSLGRPKYKYKSGHKKMILVESAPIYE